MAQANPNPPARWPVFLCYRQADGLPTAEWLYERLHDKPISEDGQVLATLEVYLDRRAPATKDWREIHLPALQRARSLIVIITPGLFGNFGRDDWVHRELNWWLNNRQTAPLLVETSGEGERWIPAKLKKRWPNAQRVEVRLADWSRLADRDAVSRGQAELGRILDGIRINERQLVFEDLERVKRLVRRLQRSLAVAVLASLLALVAFGLALSNANRANKLANEKTSLASAEAKARDEAEKQTRLAEARLKHAGHSMYDSQLALVASRMSTDPSFALGILEDPLRCPEELRDFTWRFYHRLCRRDQLRWVAHDKRIACVLFVPDGKALVTASHDGTVKVWDTETAEQRLTIAGHRGPVTAAALSTDGMGLVTGDYSGQVRLWDVKTGQERMAFAGHSSQVHDVAISPNGRCVAASSSTTLLMWDAASGKQRTQIKGPPGAFWTLAFRPDGKMLIAGGVGSEKEPLSGGLRLFSGADYAEMVQSPAFRLGSFTSLAFATDGMTVLALTNIGSLVSLHLGTFHYVTHHPEGRETGVALALRPDGRMLATASRLDLYLTTGLPPRAAPEDDRSSNGPRKFQFGEIASVARYRAVRLWDVGSLQSRSYLHGVEADVFCLAFSPDGHLLATGDDKGRITLWDLTPRPERATLSARGQEMHRLHFAANGRTLLGVSKQLRLWDLATGQDRLTQNRTLDSRSIVSPDGKWLVVPTTGGDRSLSLEVWDFCEGKTTTPSAGQRRRGGAGLCAEQSPACGSKESGSAQDSNMCLGRFDWRITARPREQRQCQESAFCLG
jgi:WD40 repeat protein